MSTATIDEVIRWRVNEGRLFLLRPRRLSTAWRRTLLVAAPLWEMLNSPEGEDEVWEKRVAELAADLEAFLSASQIVPKYLFLLSPTAQGVWEIRSTQPDPQMRILGCFAKRDVFVAIDHQFRNELGQFESLAWRAAKRHCLAQWRNLFHPWEQKKETNVHLLVSGAIHAKFFR